MIIVDNKFLTYSKACQRLKVLQGDRELARDELSEVEDRERELEGEIYSLTNQINKILEQVRTNDLTAFLPSPLFFKGYQLIEVISAQAIKGTGFWGETSCGERYVLLESPAGEVLATWPRGPSLGDLMDMARISV